MDVRTGNGFDVHAFGPGEAVTLCGVRVPHGRGLVGHSDADVGLHALTDAIFGALAEGDIGQWFPPSDPQWKGAASEVFLAKAVERAGARGFRIAHRLHPRLRAAEDRPHAEAMRASVAGIVGIDADRVSVKATTSERLGFTGREEGIAALATATLVRGPDGGRPAARGGDLRLCRPRPGRAGDRRLGRRGPACLRPPLGGRLSLCS
jgi:2-C-methyl-D-erythritol 4-phosphate cytidylyltransferase / 2-C-methyl-D-erythritol 2,4-cyclodiphosphate synthase